jgi:hypothetical protein
MLSARDNLALAVGFLFEVKYISVMSRRFFRSL